MRAGQDGGKRGNAAEHLVLVGRRLQQYGGHGGLVEIFNARSDNAHTDGTHPVSDLGQSCHHVIEHLLCTGCIVVSDVQHAL